MLSVKQTVHKWSHNINMPSTSFDNVAKCKCVPTVINRNYVYGNLGVNVRFSLRLILWGCQYLNHKSGMTEEFERTWKEATLARRESGTVWKTSNSTVAQARFEPSTSQVQTCGVTVTSSRSADKDYCSSVYGLETRISRSPGPYYGPAACQETGHVYSVSFICLNFRFRYELIFFLKIASSWCL
jgi:hypothetical protein